MDLFYCLKPSIKTFSCGWKKTIQFMAKNSDVSSDEDLQVASRKQEPSVNLENTTLWEMDNQTSVSDILSISVYYPNILHQATFDINTH